jgi:hypothetical protein
VLNALRQVLTPTRRHRTINYSLPVRDRNNQPVGSAHQAPSGNVARIDQHRVLIDAASQAGATTSRRELSLRDSQPAPSGVADGGVKARTSAEAIAADSDFE